MVLLFGIGKIYHKTDIYLGRAFTQITNMALVNTITFDKK